MNKIMIIIKAVDEFIDVSTPYLIIGLVCFVGYILYQDYKLHRLRMEYLKKVDEK